MCIPLDLDATFGNADRRFGTHGLVICVSSPIFSGDFLSDRV